MLDMLTVMSCRLQMIFHSKAIAIVLLIDMVALLMYNFSGMCVTGIVQHCIRPCVCMVMHTCKEAVGTSLCVLQCSAMRCHLFAQTTLVCTTIMF